MTNWKDDLLEIVKEKGIVGIISEYKKEMELLRINQLRGELDELYLQSITKFWSNEEFIISEIVKEKEDELHRIVKYFYFSGNVDLYV